MEKGWRLCKRGFASFCPSFNYLKVKREGKGFEEVKLLKLLLDDAVFSGLVN